MTTVLNKRSHFGNVSFGYTSYGNIGKVALVVDEKTVEVRTVDLLAQAFRSFPRLSEVDIQEPLRRSTVRDVDSSLKCKCMFFAVLVRQWISILHMYTHIDGLQYNSFVGMIKHFLYIIPSSDLDCLLSGSEVVPLTILLVLEYAIVVSGCLVEDIFVVDVACGGTPGVFVVHAD